MSSQVIPDAAVDAAAHTVRLAAWGHISPEEAARQILEAAAPHLRQAFYLEMNARAVEDELNTQFRTATYSDD